MKLQHLAVLLSHFGESLRDLRRSGLLQHLERSQLAAHELTAVVPIAPGASHAALTRALAEFDVREKSAQHSVLRQVPALHTLRIVPLAAADGTPFAIALSFLCDGNVLDVLEELFERARDRFEPVFACCAGYPKQADPDAWLAYVRAHRVRSSYVFRDSRQLDPHAVCLHPSAEEIQRALELRRRFRQHAIAHQGDTSHARQHAFERDFASQREVRVHYAASNENDAPERVPAPGGVLPLTAFERPVEHEGMWIRRAALLARTRARRDARARARSGLQPAGLRGVHAKHHGLLRARFLVRDDVPLHLRHGIFTPGAEYDAWLRPSNADVRQRPDWLPDARGLALKIAGVPGKPLLPRAIPNGLGLPDGHSQDFTLVSHPTFFSRNARDYAILRSFVDARPDGVGEVLELSASLVAFLAKRPREAGIFARTLLRWCRHPLLLEYHSLVPFLVGPNEAVKCSLAPTAATRAVLDESLADAARAFLHDPRDYLKSALQRSLDRLSGTSLVLEFALHVAGEDALPVEDPRQDWDALGAKRIVVATLTIDAQDATSALRMASAEDLVMTPWHGLAAHRPLGSLNRARLSAYLASQTERWKANGITPVPRPTGDFGSGSDEQNAARGGAGRPAAHGGGALD